MKLRATLEQARNILQEQTQQGNIRAGTRTSYAFISVKELYHIVELLDGVLNENQDE